MGDLVSDDGVYMMSPKGISGGLDINTTAQKVKLQKKLRSARRDGEIKTRVVPQWSLGVNHIVITKRIIENRVS